MSVVLSNEQLVLEAAFIGWWVENVADDKRTQKAVESIIMEMFECDYDDNEKLCVRAVAEYNRRRTYKRLGLGLTEFQQFYAYFKKSRFTELKPRYNVSNGG